MEMLTDCFSHFYTCYQPFFCLMCYFICTACYCHVNLTVTDFCQSCLPKVVSSCSLQLSSCHLHVDACISLLWFLGQCAQYHPNRDAERNTPSNSALASLGCQADTTSPIPCMLHFCGRLQVVVKHCVGHDLHVVEANLFDGWRKGKGKANLSGYNLSFSLQQVEMQWQLVRDPKQEPSFHLLFKP